MTRSAEAKAWDGIVRTTLGEHGWKITAGGYGSRRTPRNDLSASMRHDRRAQVIHGRVDVTSRDYDAAAHTIAEITGWPRRDALSLLTASVAGAGVARPVDGDLQAAAAFVADELQRQAIDLDERFTAPEDYDPFIEVGAHPLEKRMIWTLAQGDQAAVLEQARALLADPDHVRTDFRRPSPRTLAQHIVEWLAPVTVTHAISGPSWSGASPLQVPWGDDVSAVIADALRFASTRHPEAYIVWAVPSGASFSPTMPAPGTGYLQCAGRGDEWTIEVNRLVDGRARNLVVGRAGGDPDPGAVDIEIPWARTTLRVRPHECFTRDELVPVFARWVQDGEVDPAMTQRALDIP